ncbi:MAG: J domain-containing protein [Acidobacteriaceae bacterium]
MPKQVDYYEFLQISPNADQETIHRVYHFLAMRFHPDNPESGDADKFNTLKRAYDVLSDPASRAQYDLHREHEAPHYTPLSSAVDFMDQMEGEHNRRLALMAVLYYRRRSTPMSPGVSLAEVESRMGFPRDYLDFTTWYLERKGYITRADNSDFTITVDGVDFVETQRCQIPILNKLLTATAGPTSNGMDHETNQLDNPGSHILTEEALPEERRNRTDDRRVNKVDRRLGLPDPRTNPVERRVRTTDRRGSSTGRRSKTSKDKARSQPDPVH